VIRVEVVYCAAPHATDRSELQLPDGATLADALRASGVLERNGLAVADVDAGIWGRVQPPDAPLRDRDRVEIYRPLTVDPKEARRLRYRGARGDRATRTPQR
jgi:putative ubiquitin-RnfH superfamily antitoxin RatB of RatAB toxin-antitoxin module